MVTVETTEDKDIIKRVITHSKIWSAVSDDFAPMPDEFEPTINGSTVYLLVKDGDEILGLWAFLAKTRICWDVHTCLLPNSWGPRARQALQVMLDWLWKTTDCLRLVTEVPEYNKLAYRFALEAGMKEFGKNEAAYMKYGRLQDLILMGMSKPGMEKCQS